MRRHFLPILNKPCRRQARRSLDPWTSPSRGTLHYEGVRRGIFFFVALLLLLLPIAVAAHCAGPMPTVPETGVRNPVRAAAPPQGAILFGVPRRADHLPR